MTTTDSAQQDGFLELLLRVPNSERNRLLFGWSALSEMGAAPKVYLEAARRIAPRTAAVADFPPASELDQVRRKRQRSRLHKTCPKTTALKIVVVARRGVEWRGGCRLQADE